MKRLVLLATLTSLLFASQQKYEVSLTVGGTKVEKDMHLDEHVNFGIRLGVENNIILEKMFDTIEFGYERSENVDVDNTTLETNINRYSIHFIHSYTNFENIIPYGLVGLGYEDFTKEYLKANDSVTVNFGVGIKYFLNEDISLRAEVRDQVNLQHSVQHEMIYTIGIGYTFGEKSKTIVENKDNIVPASVVEEVKKEDKVTIMLDSDKDGVLDSNDKCPMTLEGCSVDSNGCAIDYTFDINFDTNKYNIKNNDLEKLHKFVKFMNIMSQPMT